MKVALKAKKKAKPLPPAKAKALKAKKAVLKASPRATSLTSMKKIEVNHTLVFIVDVKANEQQIKQAVKKLNDIDMAKVNTLIRPGEEKKAYVPLAPDYDALDVANKIGII
ncbi:60S ribosomal protein L23a-like [Eptesicus fuscus]|uniref:60S ribosomal protein L23a-like n=1 Tax=Eptesicus fuscus TaxID=29078 RepID=UPI0024047392|nr:60S ribosomal protein L23a-like [Eptesicus fuscus]